jgi:hypothetical protein
VLVVPHTSVDDFLSRDIFASSTQLNMLFWKKVRVSTLENHDGQVVFLSKMYSILTGKQRARPSNIDGLLSRDTYVSSTQMNWPIETKRLILLFLNPYMLDVFPQNLSKFSQGNNVLDDPPSNLGGLSFERHMCFFKSPERPILNQ